VEVTLEIQCGLGAELPKLLQKKTKGRTYEMTSVLTVTSDNTFVDYRRIPYVHSKDSVWLGSDALCRTRSLKDVKTFKVFAELTKPSQTIVTIIGSVRTDLDDLHLAIDLLQETIAGDAVSRSFRPDLPGNEYPTLNTKPPVPSQDHEEHNGVVWERGGSQIIPNPHDLHGPRFSSPSPVPSKPQARAKPLAGSGRSNSREAKVGIPYGEWKPKQLSNGNYKQVSSLSFGFGPYLVSGATTPARIGIIAGISGTLISVALSGSLNWS